jgi:hypothetical protein
MRNLGFIVIALGATGFGMVLPWEDKTRSLLIVFFYCLTLLGTALKEHLLVKAILGEKNKRFPR